MVIKEGGDIRCNSGPWNGVSISGSNTLRKNHIYTFGVVINEKEVYFHYELLKDSVYSRFIISDAGVAQSCNIVNLPVCGCLNMFKPKDPDSWGSGNWSNGCIRNAPLNCEDGDSFLKYTSVKFPDTHHSWYVQHDYDSRRMQVTMLEKLFLDGICKSRYKQRRKGMSTLVW
ncbi:hypothetical protein ACS0TY_017304 [Phlomoides rotata]